jgi:CRP/FNR family transcriptional regulator
MASDMGQKRGEGLFIPMPLSRQELADMTGTTIETAIRIMSRWGKQHIVQTESDGFLVKNPGALESLSQE